MELAAISFTFPVSFIVGIVTMGLGIGTSSVCSRLFGAKKLEDVERVAVHAMLLGLVAGLIIVATGLMTIDPLFTLLGADETTLPVIHRYMKIYYWSGIFLVVPMIGNSVLRASGNAKTPAMIMTAAAILQYRARSDPDFRPVRLSATGSRRSGDRDRAGQCRHPDRID